jgi:hypothetical protein
VASADVFVSGAGFAWFASRYHDVCSAGFACDPVNEPIHPTLEPYASLVLFVAGLLAFGLLIAGMLVMDAGN